MKEPERIALISRLAAQVITIAAATVLIMIYAIAQSAPTSQELVQRGAYLARAGDCIACHTAPKGKPYAGGAPIATSMGVIYSTNITPDLETGIGHYSMEDFFKVMREGLTEDGDHLYPAMPYTSYAKVSQADRYCQIICVKFLKKGRFWRTFPTGFDLQCNSIFKETKARRR